MRWYDPEGSVRFLSVDPLSKDYPWYTPYQFAGNSPIRYFDLDGLEEHDPFPDAYYRDAPKIDMTDGPKYKVTAEGHPRNANYFWKQMLKDHSNMLSDENQERIKRGNFKEIEVDDKWIEHNPTTKNFKGDQLIHHHIDRGSIAAAMPATPHRKLTKLLHSRIPNTRKSVKGGLNSFFNLYGLYKDFFGNDPHDLNMLFSAGDKKNTLYFDISSDQYFVITDIKSSKDGTVIINYDTYKDYSYDPESKRFVGLGYKESRIRTQNEKTKEITDSKKEEL